jgi:hypothetical protein
MALANLANVTMQMTAAPRTGARLFLRQFVSANAGITKTSSMQPFFPDEAQLGRPSNLYQAKRMESNFVRTSRAEE